MKLVVDSNVLFTFFWEGSVFKNFVDTPVQLFSLEYALEEINKYSLELMKKTSLSKERFKKLKQELALKVEFISLKEYSPSFHKALTIVSKSLKNEYEEFVKDIDFFALALMLSCPIWSNDKLLKKQSKVIIFNTKEIIELIDIK